MVVLGLATAPRLEAVRQLVRGTARRREWRSALQCGALHLHAVPSLQCSVDQLLQGGEDSEDSVTSRRAAEDEIDILDIHCRMLIFYNFNLFLLR